MKTIMLLRHGKSDWYADYDLDIDRPLAKRGRNDANRMGRFLDSTNMIPDVVLTSPAVRAVTTVERAAAAGAWQVAEWRIVDSLYHGGVRDLIAAMRDLDDAFQSVLLVGHEPTWSEATSTLIGGGDVRFPTAALAQLSIESDRWADVGSDSCEMVSFTPPRLLKRLGWS